MADQPARSAPLLILGALVLVLATLVGWGLVVAVHHAQAHHVFSAYANNAGDVCTYLNATECATQCGCGVCGADADVGAECMAALYYAPAVRARACSRAWTGPRAVCGTRDHGAALLTSGLVVLVTALIAVAAAAIAGRAEPLRAYFSRPLGYTAMA
jgi:hypothetical protein